MIPNLQAQLNIRQALEGDKPRLIELINAAYRVEDFFKYEDRVNAQEVDEYFGQGFFFVGEQESKVQTCIYLELKPDRAYFGTLCVDPSCQGMGLGKRMIDYVEEVALKAGCRFMDIQIVNIRPELPVYYGKYGYKTGPTSTFPKPSKIPCHFVQMTKELRITS
ncbi:MAG: GNAT family N-acetyltransferase [Bacteroidia bacterium]